MGRIARRFVRVKPRRRARAFMLGLLSDLPHKNPWTLAEQAGNANPYALQHLLSRTKWEADAVRDDDQFLPGAGAGRPTVLGGVSRFAGQHRGARHLDRQLPADVARRNHPAPPGDVAVGSDGKIIPTPGGAVSSPPDLFRAGEWQHPQ